MARSPLQINDLVKTLDNCGRTSAAQTPMTVVDIVVRGPKFDVVMVHDHDLNRITESLSYSLVKVGNAMENLVAAMTDISCEACEDFDTCPLGAECPVEIAMAGARA